MVFLEVSLVRLVVDIFDNFRRVYGRVNLGYYREFLKSSWKDLKWIFRGIFEGLMGDILEIFLGNFLNRVNYGFY